METKHALFYHKIADLSQQKPLWKVAEHKKRIRKQKSCFDIYKIN